MSLVLAILVGSLRIVVLSWLVACSKGSNPFSSGSDPSSSSEGELSQLLLRPETIGFAEIKSFVFEKSCNECHGSDEPAGHLNFSSYQNLIKSADEEILHPYEPSESLLYTSLLATDGEIRMPPLPKDLLGEKQKELVFQWIKMGAPEIGGGEGIPGASLQQQLQAYFENPETIDYGVVTKFVFKPGRCLDCHSAKGRTPNKKAITFGVNMESYESLFLLNGIVPGQLVSYLDLDPVYQERIIGSRIFEAVAVNQSMPPKEEGFQPLNALRVKLLRQWILNCAIEDYSKLKNDLLIKNSNHSGKVRVCP